MNKIKVLAFARFQSVLAGLVGLLAGIIYSFGGAIYDIFTIGLNYGTALAFLAIVGMPLIFTSFGFILGIIEAILFNLFAKQFGGFKIDFYH